MPITQKYSMNIGNAYAGMEYGLRTAMYIRTVEDNRQSAAQACLFGGAVVSVANTVRGVQAAFENMAAGTVCYGIITRQINHEAASYPSINGVMGSRKGDVLGLMVEGQIMVKLTGVAKRDQILSYVEGGSWKGDDTNGFINVKALEAGNFGDVIPVSIVSTPTVAVAATPVKA